MMSDSTMHCSYDKPCRRCGGTGYTIAVVGRGLAGDYHPECMHLAIDERQNRALERLRHLRQRKGAA